MPVRATARCESSGPRAARRTSRFGRARIARTGRPAARPRRLWPNKPRRPKSAPPNQTADSPRRAQHIGTGMGRRGEADRLRPTGHAAALEAVNRLAKAISSQGTSVVARLPDKASEHADAPKRRQRDRCDRSVAPAAACGEVARSPQPRLRRRPVRIFLGASDVRRTRRRDCVLYRPKRSPKRNARRSADGPNCPLDAGLRSAVSVTTAGSPRKLRRSDRSGITSGNRRTDERYCRHMASRSVIDASGTIKFLASGVEQRLRPQSDKCVLRIDLYRVLRELRTVVLQHHGADDLY